MLHGNLDGTECEKPIEKIWWFGYNKEKVLSERCGTDEKDSRQLCHIKKRQPVYDIHFKDQVIRFATSSKLERYTEVKEWDKGYLVVMAKYKNLNEMEEYIDLIPILQNLYYDVGEFLAPIKAVRIDYAT